MNSPAILGPDDKPCRVRPRRLCYVWLAIILLKK